MAKRYSKKHEWAHGKPSSNPEHVCRYRNCMKPGRGRPPYCKDHTPIKLTKTTIPWPVPLKRLTAGRA